MNILFTCAGRRTYLLKYFHEQLGKDDQIVATDMQLTAPAFSAADVRIVVPSIYDHNYIDKLIEICKSYNITALISLNDLELPILAANRQRFAEANVNLIVSNSNVIELCFDKFRTAEFVQKIGLKSPKTFISLHDAEIAISKGDLKFPLVLKPRWGSGSIGIEFVNDIEELREEYCMLLKKVKKTILATASSGEEYILIQQKINGQEYGLDVMNDLAGRNRGVSVKKKLAMRAGETDKAMTIDRPDIREVGIRLGKALGHIANLDVDVFESDGELYVLELNPRFGGGFPFSYEAGVNMPGAIIEWLKGRDVDDSMLIPKYGLTFAKCDYLVEI